VKPTRTVNERKKQMAHVKKSIENKNGKKENYAGSESHSPHKLRKTENINVQVVPK